MSNPFVSSYSAALAEAFGRGFEEIPCDKVAIVKKIVEEIHTEVLDKIEDRMRESMLTQLNDKIRHTASSIASSMLANALCGDDKEIKNLFGFNDWYLKHSCSFSGLPSQWKLIDAIVHRRPDIFVDERIKQRDAEITDLKASVSRLKDRLDYLVSGECDQ